MDVKIQRPTVPQHFMVLRTVKGRVTITLPKGNVVAQSDNAVRLMEAGKTLYDPVIYVPISDVVIELHRNEKTSHCPLKGDAVYFDIKLQDTQFESLAWSYETPLEFSQALKGLIAFYPNQVVIEERPIEGTG